ncbi:Intermediate filament tail domain-containing protein 1 [Chelonia mydas]|uniref:Intermediate filament tail domain-containing protein 1 n=1 Tax=Chelonia mydas TaxID=8469 RepID=M7CD23_CHEMY|nr:Intermediate filament tail domain-containing protein 1 [Chelonia mydas]
MQRSLIGAVLKDTIYPSGITYKVLLLMTKALWRAPENLPLLPGDDPRATGETQKEDNLHRHHSNRSEGLGEDTISNQAPPIDTDSSMQPAREGVGQGEDGTSCYGILSVAPEQQPKAPPVQPKVLQKKDDTHVLRLLLHQRDLEIQGLRCAAQKEPTSRLSFILQELVSTRQRVWSEMGNNIEAEPSNMVLRRIPKHMSFLDSFFKDRDPATLEREKDNGRTQTAEVVQAEFNIYPKSSTDSEARAPGDTGFLKITTVNRKGKFVRILNTSLDQDMDLSGFVGGSPVSICRFPPDTTLPALHHITVWAAGTDCTHKKPTDMTLRAQQYFRTGPECTTVLSNAKGQISSPPPCCTSPASFGTLPQSPCDDMEVTPVQPRLAEHGPAVAVKEKRFSPNKEKEDEEEDFAPHGRQPPTAEPKPRVFKTALDTTIPTVALTGQKNARSKYGFKHMAYLPITTDMQLRRYCPAR